MKDGRGINNDNCADNGKHSDEDKDNKYEDKNQKRHRHPSTSWMRRLVSIKKNIGTHKDKLQEKVKHSDKEKDKKTNDHLSASCMR